MKSTVVDESLSSNKTNVLFQRILQDFKINSTVWEIYTSKQTNIIIVEISESTLDLKNQKDKKMFASDALSRLHTKADQDEYDVFPLNF